jgi:hypothetical protein
MRTAETRSHYVTRAAAQTGRSGRPQMSGLLGIWRRQSPSRGHHPPFERLARVDDPQRFFCSRHSKHHMEEIMKPNLPLASPLYPRQFLVVALARSSRRRSQ